MDYYNLPYLFQLAEHEFKKSTHFKPMGAFISRKGIMVSGGHNKLKTHPIYSNGKECYSIHAEMDAILHYRGEIMGDTIWVFRKTKKGKIGMAKPCPYCMKHIIEAGIAKVIYTIPVYPYYEIIKL